MSNAEPTFEAVKALVVKTIGVEDRADSLTPETRSPAGACRSCGRFGIPCRQL